MASIQVCRALPALLSLGVLACAPALEDAADEQPAVALGQARQAAAVCADGPTVYGIDVSRYQGTIDWQKVADSGVKFAYIQVSRYIDDLDA
jgi:GH25 family lysozyme M1 (1,4-beta-N-acetylmuramidase)